MADIYSKKKRSEIMANISPEGPVYQAGTLSGNPLAMAAGVATLTALKEPGFYDALDKKAAGFAEKFQALMNKYFEESTLNRQGSVMTPFFAKGPITDFDSAMTADTEKFGKYYRLMLDQGIYLAPSQFEGMFISAAHSDEDLERTLEKTEWSFKKLQK